jgi:hypothetical protein
MQILKASCLQRFFLVTGFLFSTLLAKTQSIDSIKLQQLSAQVEQLTTLIVQKDSLEYENTRELLMNGFHNSYMLYERIEFRKKEISDQQYSIRLLNLNNPGTAQMVKQFEDFMKKLVTDKLSAVLNTDSLKKKKIFRVLENIFQNPIIAPILNSNPISTAISSAFNFISSLVEPKVDVSKTGIGGMVKDVKVQLDNIIDKTLLNGLTADLVPYIRFFDTLYVVNNQFSTRLSLLKQRSKSLSESYARLWNYYKDLGIKPGETPVKKQQLFEKTFPAIQTGGTLSKYAIYLQDEKIKTAIRYSNEISLFHDKFNELTEEYNTALRDFKDQYIAVLSRYKDRLSLYATVLQQAYTDLTTVEEVSAGMIIGNTYIDGSPVVDPLEEKVKRSQWRYNTVDWDSKKITDKIF